ncbi:hypothetical protein [Xanthomonas phage XacN1]|nr:hypothetical protein [Xanthomonas phage XacN1]
MNRPENNWYDDFPTEPIGGGNPYYRCSHCKISVPQINYRLEGHAPDCEYRQKHQTDLTSRGVYPRGTKVIKMKTPKYPHEKKP